MTNEQKERFEIAKGLCAFNSVDFWTLYDFVKNGEPKTDEAVEAKAEPRNTDSGAVADGVYAVFKDGSYIAAHLLDADAKTNPETKNIVGVGIKQGERSLTVALHDCAGGEEITLTSDKDTTNEIAYYVDDTMDAVADWNGKANTIHLQRIGLNPAIVLKEGQWLPSVGEMYLIYTNLKAVNLALKLIGAEPLKRNWYWTSTEGSAAFAWNLYLSNGYLAWLGKAANKLYVRPVSAFIS